MAEGKEVNDTLGALRAYTCESDRTTIVATAKNNAVKSNGVSHTNSEANLIHDLDLLVAPSVIQLPSLILSATVILGVAAAVDCSNDAPADSFWLLL